MSTFPRRSFIAGLSTIPFALWFEQHASAQTLMRFNVMSPQGQQMVTTYRNAVRTMMNAPQNSPVGWLFQWYTHGVRSDTNKGAEIARVYPTASPQKALAQEVWNTCQPHFPGSVQDFFLPWHRMYAFFFERIIRKVSNNPAFTLPYWNYSTTASPSGPRLPAGFRTPATAANSLFRRDRNALANNGQPIDQGSSGTLSLSILRQCTYSVNGAQPGFNGGLETGLHGNVHVLVGTTVGMGRVPWAANDPLFWMHHCNIDRLWASWNRGGRTNPVTSTWLNKPFVFADENGNRVVGTVRDFVNINALGYTYDRFEPIPTCPPTASLSVPTPQRRAAVPSGPISLGAQPVTINLEPSGAATGLGDDIINRVRTLRPDRRLYLVLRNLQTQIQPGVVYQVFLELPAAASAASARNFLVGTINFFGAEAHEHGAAAQNRFFSFDITQLARALVTRNRLSANPSVTIAPAGQPAADASPVIGEITLEEQ